MLLQIANGSEFADVTLLTDRALLDGWSLFGAILNGISPKFEEIHLFMFEKLEKEHRKQILPQFLGKIHFHDFVSDPLGWNDEKNEMVTNFWISEIVENLGSKTTVIVIDSLSLFLDYFGIQHFCFNIEKIRDAFSSTNKQFSIFSFLHRDLCDVTTVKSSEYVSNCIINLVSEDEVCGPGEKSPKFDPKTQNMCKIIHRKKGGKITESIESFFISKIMIVTSKPWQPENRIKDVDVGDSPDSSPDEEEMVRSTFSLKLSKQEKEARSKLVMPYTKPAHLKVKMDEDTPSSGGMIYYEPDDTDDFDDEDPDDDLDF